ncbi:MAG: MBL fold metallo-hydrolase, partial [Candidatus Bathyarchaeia archaeon]
LRKEGLTKEKIDIIINTHLHHDHCGNNNLFRDKELIVHRKEIPFARKIYWPEYLNAYIYPLKVHLIDKTQTIADDVEIIETPGHTPGSISVRVKTNEGYVLIAGDTVYSKVQFHSRAPSPFSSDEEKLLRSLNKIANMPLHLIISGHDAPFNPLEKGG